jgi:hypothetical protein
MYRFQRLDASGLHERVRSALPLYRQLFRDAQEKTGIDWRLLAALAYQESKWDAQATSETGVRGLMQLTAETAKRLGGVDRLDPQASALAAARYLHDLKERLPPRIAEPDTTWLALAAYNIGVAHPEARDFAEAEVDADRWSAVKKISALPCCPNTTRTPNWLRARRHAGWAGRSRARVLRHPARSGAAARRASRCCRMPDLPPASASGDALRQPSSDAAQCARSANRLDRAFPACTARAPRNDTPPSAR